MIQYFTAYTINCLCHIIRLIFRALGIYNFRNTEIETYVYILRNKIKIIYVEITNNNLLKQQSKIDCNFLTIYIDLETKYKNL